MTVFNGHHRTQERIELHIICCKKTIQNNITYRTVLTVKRRQMSYTLHGAMTARAQKNKSTNRKKTESEPRGDDQRNTRASETDSARQPAWP